MPPHRLKRNCYALVAACGAWSGCALAQTAQPLTEVRVTATPLASDGLDPAQPASVLRGAELNRRQAATLGETLLLEPGVQSSGFGIGAGRPVIRGLDAARVRVTSDGLDTLDASTISPDHAVTADPLAARQIEVLRGPATLLYGGGAIGGLVNVVAGRIPQARLDGVHGEWLASSDSATRGGQGALGLRGGARGWNWTANAFGRAASDYAIPGRAAVDDPQSARGRLPNSFARARGGSVGGSYVGERLTVGLAQSDSSSDYGIPGGSSRIDLRQQRTEALVSAEQPLPGFEALRVRHVENRYRHDEVEATGEVGTAFRNRGRDSRIELRHLPVAGITGVVGVQLRDRTLSATGEEAYVPATRERMAGVFWVAQRALGPARLEFGARHETARLDPLAPGARPARRFGLVSASVGAVVPIGAAGHSVGAQLSTAQRAPAIEELYAQGPHGATRTFELGDARLRRERAVNLDLSLRRSTPTWQWRAGVFVNRFRDYVFGRLTDADGDGVRDRVDRTGAIVNTAADPSAGDYQRVVYDHARATFRGLEAELRWRPEGTPWRLRAFADTARGRLDDVGNVPRMAPMRAGGSVDYDRGAWSGFVSLLAVRRQDRLATLETPTAGYRRLDAEVAYTLQPGENASLQLFVQGRNLLDDEIRLATSFIKDFAPQPGRSVLVGVRGRL